MAMNGQVADKVMFCSQYLAELRDREVGVDGLFRAFEAQCGWFARSAGRNNRQLLRSGIVDGAALCCLHCRCLTADLQALVPHLLPKKYGLVDNFVESVLDCEPLEHILCAPLRRSKEMDDELHSLATSLDATLSVGTEQLASLSLRAAIEETMQSAAADEGVAERSHVGLFRKCLWHPPTSSPLAVVGYGVG